MMLRAATLRFALGLAMLAPCPSVLAQAAPNPAKEADIRELMELTGAGKLGVESFNQTIGMMKQAMPTVPEAFWTRYAAKVNANGLVNRVVPIYANYFTAGEIQQLLAFYRTPLGQKLITTQPAILRDSMAAGQKWGEELAEQILKELAAEGYK